MTAVNEAKVTGMARTRTSTPPRWLRISAVVAIGAALWLALAAWALSSPVGSAPDDDFHLANIYCAAGAAECVEEGERLKPCYAHDPSIPGSCQTAGNAALPRTTGHVPGYYPPLYSSTMGVFIGDTVGDTVRNVRLANVTLTTLLVMGSILLSRRSLRIAVAAGWVSFGIPLGMFMTTSSSPNAWSILGIAAMWGPAVSFMYQDGRHGLAVARGLFASTAAIMALGARSESPLFVGAFALALLIAFLPWPLHRMADWAKSTKLLFPLGLGIASLLTLTTFGSSKVNHSLYGDFEHFFTFTDAVKMTLYTPLAGLGFPDLPANKLGWSDTAMPDYVSIISLIGIGALAAAGVRVWSGRKLALLGTFATTSFLVILFFWSIAWHSTRYPPRYFLPVFMVTVGLFLLPNLGKLRRIPGRLVLPVVAVLATITNSAALLTNTVRYVSGISADTAISPTTLAEAATPQWWWSFLGLPPFDLWALGTAAFALAAIGGTLLIRAYTAPKPPPTSTPSRGYVEGWDVAINTSRYSQPSQVRVPVSASGAPTPAYAGPMPPPVDARPQVRVLRAHVDEGR